MKSDVFFTTARSKMGKSIPKKFRKLLIKSGLYSIFSHKEVVAIKVHWGERDNIGYLKPVFARIVASEIMRKQGRPFITDTNVLYKGSRYDAISNIRTASGNGYNLASLGAPVIIADGLRGSDSVEVAIPNSKYLKSVKIAGAIYHSNAMVVISHFKGHILFGYGATLKNLGMGCSTPAGKQMLHSDVKPHVHGESCLGCGDCIKVCPADAINFIDHASGKQPNRKEAFINEQKCIGCGECVAVCPAGAIPINWKTAQKPLLGKTAEAAYGALSNKKGKALFINFLYDITPDCDCADWTDIPVVPNIGIVASTDPVAIEQASIDLVNKSPVIPGSVLDGTDHTEDKIFALKNRDYNYLLNHAQELKLGTREYNLIKVT